MKRHGYRNPDARNAAEGVPHSLCHALPESDMVIPFTLVSQPCPRTLATDEREDYCPENRITSGQSRTSTPSRIAASPSRATVNCCVTPFIGS